MTVANFAKATSNLKQNEVSLCFLSTTGISAATNRHVSLLTSNLPSHRHPSSKTRSCVSNIKHVCYYACRHLTAIQGLHRAAVALSQASAPRIWLRSLLEQRLKLVWRMRIHFSIICMQARAAVAGRRRGECDAMHFSSSCQCGTSDTQIVSRVEAVLQW